MRDVLINSAWVWIDGVSYVNKDTAVNLACERDDLRAQLAAEKERAGELEAELDRTREAATWGGMADAERIGRSECERDTAIRALDEVRARYAELERAAREAKALHWDGSPPRTTEKERIDADRDLSLLRSRIWEAIEKIDALPASPPGGEPGAGEATATALGEAERCLENGDENDALWHILDHLKQEKR